MGGAIFLFALLGAASSLLSISEALKSRRALAVLLASRRMEGGQTAHEVHVRVANVGRATIRPEDFDGPIRLRFLHVPAAACRIEESEPRGLRLSVDLGPEDERGRVIEVSPLLLNQADRFTLCFDVGGFPVLPTVDLRVADTRLLILRARGIERRRRGLLAYFGFAVLAQFSIALAVLGLALATGNGILVAYLPIAVVAAMSLNYSAARRALKLFDNQTVDSRNLDRPPASPRWRHAGRALVFLLYVLVAAPLCAITENLLWGFLIALPVWLALIFGAAWRSRRRKGIF
jgi:hypothetical protein